ncbi:hypothetical protein [uncultured Megamonas sp.]|uniref:hypothetical protein n=1 Tax=uncultured Megamonas sp. TaxID=286140 RepID=UPI0025FB74E3|nr:hypothetical protein [uncultured Megamonas sp.]
MDIEKMLQDIDFSQHSKVKENLRQRLLINRKYNLNMLDNNELSMDELDNVVAAVKTPLYNKENNINHK